MDEIQLQMIQIGASNETTPKDWKCPFLASHTYENIYQYIARMGNGRMCHQDGHYREIYLELGIGNNAGGGGWSGDLRYIEFHEQIWFPLWAVMHSHSNFTHST